MELSLGSGPGGCSVSWGTSAAGSWCCALVALDRGLLDGSHTVWGIIIVITEGSHTVYGDLKVS